MEKKGESWNYGTEQEHLNFVEGARLHITALRAASGPGIEFLQYLQPGPGKPYPENTRADDIWYWQTNLWVNNVQKLYNKWQHTGATFISKGITLLKKEKDISIKSFIVRDPDGHALRIMEKIKN